MGFPELEPATAVRDTSGERVPYPGTGASPPTDIGNIRVTALSFLNIHEHGDLLLRYLQARRSIFIDRLHWSVSDVDGLEFDQYDNPFCRWVILHEFGVILGGVRLIPTDAACGIYSYMLRDAQNGTLEDLPTDVLFFKAPVDSRVWEASRFFITDKVPAARRRTVQRILFQSMSRTAGANGATSILGIVPAVWSRWARRLDAGATPIGARFSIEGTWSQSVLFHIGKDAPEDELVIDGL
jgi:N-acyl-L-homoserine lactone synthetase